MQRPAGVTAISVLLFLAAIYLWTIGVVKLLVPEAISLMSGTPLMYGLELAGPHMAMLVGTGYALVGWGLFRVHNWARWAAMLVMVVAVAALVPKISMAELGVPVLWYGLQIALRAAVAWYLAQAPAVIDAFAGKRQA
jgi:glucose uptake protein GlcU